MPALLDRPYRDPLPEVSGVPATATTSGRAPRALAGLLLSLGAGVLLVALAYYGARLNRGWAEPLFWVGLLVLFLPVALRLTGRQASREERLALVIALGLALYGVKVLLEPNAFTLHDELGQYRSVVDILRTGHLYSTNPVVPAYSFYPGLLTVTAALSSISGLGIFPCGVIVLALARVVLVGGLFLLIERVSESARIAGLAVLIYAANPNFVFFDSQFAYESLALGLGVMTLWAATGVFNRGPGRMRAFLVVALLDCALIVTHHLTSYAVALAIMLWAAAEAIRRRSVRDGGLFTLLAGSVLAATAGYAAWSWPETQSDIGSSITGSINGLISVVAGQTGGRHPFTAAPGYTNPFLERAVGLASVGLLLVALPWGLYALWRRRPRDTGLVILSVCALLYPLSLALRLTSGGSETSNRTSEFVFVALGTILAVAFVAQRGAGADSRRLSMLPVRLLAGVYLGLVFVGGITVGNAPYQLLPGSFKVAAANRSVDTEGVAAANWARRLTPGSNFLGDETAEELMTAYTQLHQERGSFANKGIGQLFTSPRVGQLERLLIKYYKLRFLVVDKRDSTQLPFDGHYFEGADPGSYTRPIPHSSLTKFSHNPCIQQVFSSGHILIYDSGPIFSGCQ
jgi:hypothetical protein